MTAVTAQVIEEAKTEISGAADATIDKAKTLTITNTTGAEMATTIGKELKVRRQTVVDRLAGMKSAAHSVHADICKLEREATEPIDAALKMLNVKVIEYDDKVEAEQEAARKKADAEARAKADKEQEAEVARLLEEGKEDEAEEVFNEPPAPLPVPALPPMPTRTKSQGIRKTHKARLTNIRLVCRAVAEGKLSPAAVTFNQSWFDRQAKQDEGQNPPPGVEYYQDKTVTRRTR